MINKKTRHAIFMFMASILSISLSSCKESLYDFLDDPNALHVEVVDDSGINTPENGSDAKATRVSYNGFSTTFDEGDAIGVYAYDGSKYINSNIKFTKQADGTWMSDSKVVYSPNCTYYAYYPYSEKAYNPSSVDGDIETKFADFISDKENNFWKEDQSSKANFTASNLMLASATASSDKVVKFKMKHERGLVLINFPKWHYSYDPSKEYDVIPEFAGNTPYTQNNISYFLLKPSTTTSVMGMDVKASAGKYVLADNLTVNITPTFNFSISKDGKAWGSYTSTVPEGLNSVTSNNTDKSKMLSFTVDVNHDEWIVPETVSDVDLSMVNNDGTPRGSRETANCYLVHAPGTYKIPLVYGNAIKNGATNISAFNTSQTSNTLQTFVNHNDEAISDPWIKNNNISVDGAKLIWQDSKGLISKVGVSGDYLTFTVSPDNFKRGNALIAATANGTVVWSWHVWVTDETFTESELTTIDTGSHIYKVTPVNVGQIPAKLADGDYCKIRVMINGLPYVMKLIGPLQKKTKDISNPYYQWGRKDPAPPYTGGYDIEDHAFKLSKITNAVSIGRTIQNPGILYYNKSNRGPYNENNNNYWDMNQTGRYNVSTATVKTIYDPCPPGFCVPTSNLLYYIGRRANYTWLEPRDVRYPGMISTQNTSTLYFPASGKMTSEGFQFYHVGSGGFLWSATIDSNYLACNFLFLFHSYCDFNYDSRADALPVRAVLEEK